MPNQSSESVGTDSAPQHTPQPKVEENTARKLLRRIGTPMGFLFLIGGVFILWVIWWVVIAYVLHPVAETPLPNQPPDATGSLSPDATAATEAPTNAWSRRGLFGDMFGGLNALFAGLGFAGLFYTIIAQRVSKWDEDAGRAIGEYNRELARFETTFFQLLNSWENMVSNLDIIEGKRSQNQWVHKGRDGLSFLAKEFCGPTFLENQEWKAHSPVERVRAAYKSFYNQYQSDLGHYYRVLYNIFKFIDEKCPGEPQFYARIVKAHLSNPQVTLLFFNGIYKLGENFIPLINKYGLLEHIQAETVDDKLLEFYQRPEAYK